MDATADATLDATVGSAIGAPSFDTFLGNPLSGSASPFSFETQDSFADQFPEFTLPRTELSFSQLLPTEDWGSSKSSTLLADTSTPNPTSRELSSASDRQQDTCNKSPTTGLELKDQSERAITPNATSGDVFTSKATANCSGDRHCLVWPKLLRNHDSHDESLYESRREIHSGSVNTSFELKTPGERATSPKAVSRDHSVPKGASRDLSTPDRRLPCPVCPKSFVRKHELQYVSHFSSCLELILLDVKYTKIFRLVNISRFTVVTSFAPNQDAARSSTGIKMLSVTCPPATAPKKRKIYFFVNSKIANMPSRDFLGKIISSAMCGYGTNEGPAAARAAVWTSSSRTSESDNYMTVSQPLAQLTRLSFYHTGGQRRKLFPKVCNNAFGP